MIRVRFFGFIRSQTGVSSMDIDVGTVDDALRLISSEYDNIRLDMLKNSLIFVNSVNITELRMFKTILKDGDEVMILSPAAGG